MRSNLRTLGFLVAFLAVGTLTIGCKSPTSPSGGGNGGGNNGPDLPNQNNSEYVSANPVKIDVEIRKADRITPTGRFVEVSIVKYVPGKDKTLIAGKDTYFDVTYRTKDGLPCNCSVSFKAKGARSTADMAGFDTPFWAGKFNAPVTGVTLTDHIGTVASGPLEVPFALGNVWILEGIGDNIRVMGDDPPHAQLHSEPLGWH